MPAPWLTLLSWNVHGLPFHAAAPRLRRIADWIGARSPDLVLLQEVWVASYLRLLSRALDARYEAIAASGRARPRGGLVVLLRRDSGWRSSPARFERYEHAAPWHRLHEGDGVSGKGILAVELRRGGEFLLAVNTHLQAQYGERRYTEVRRAQLSQLAAFVAAAGAKPMLIAGDLNTEAREDLYTSHVRPLGVDLTAAARARGGATCFDRRGEKWEWIDYALLRGLDASCELTRIESHAPDDPYSDHDGLLLDLAVTP